MEQKQLKNLTLHFSNRATIACSVVVMLLFISAGRVHAQTENSYNAETRRNTWSIYAQGGVSWATDVWYPNIDAKKSYNLSPAVGGGIDYNIRPWVRVGVEYIYSRYRREQRMSAFDKGAMPIKAYGNYMMNYHNIKGGFGFNVMEFWPTRQSQWFNIYLGTGVGYMMAKGNEYGIYFNTTQTVDGKTTPVSGSISVDNSSSITFTGNVKTTNTHSSFNKVYIPTSIHFEADLCRQFTVGLKGEADWILSRENVAPKQLVFALATVRCNMGTGKIRKINIENMKGEIEDLNNRLRDTEKEVANQKSRADKAEKDRDNLQATNSELQRRLNDCESSKAEMVAEVSHFVQFDNNKAYFSSEEGEKLKAFAQSVKGERLFIIAEASSVGRSYYNQRLSERRLEAVIEALVKEGFSKDDLRPRVAIGDQNGIATAEGRRVTITVKK